LVPVGGQGIVVSVTRQITITEKVLARIPTSQDLDEQEASEIAKRRTADDWRRLADELFNNGDWAGLINHSLWWTQVCPEEADAWIYLGVAYRKSNQPAKAIEAYQQALRINPEYAEAWYNLGIAYADSNQPAKAIEVYQQALRINPEYADAWNNLGVAYNEAGQYDEAIEAYKKAICLKFRVKAGQLNSGFDPELFRLGTELAVYHVEAGSRSFIKFAKAMIDDLGAKAKPYLKSWYLGAKMWPGMEQIQEEMDSETTLEAISGLDDLFGGGSLKSFPGGIDRDAYNKAKPHFEKALADFKAAGLRSGFDPEMRQDVFIVGGAYFEHGARNFSTWAKVVIAAIGKEFARYLPGVYENLRLYPGLDTKGMTPSGEVAGELNAILINEMEGARNINDSIDSTQETTDNKAEGQPTTEGTNELLSDNDPKEIQGRLHEAPGGMATGTIQATDTNRGAADKSNDDRDKGRQGDEGHDKQWNSPTRSRGRGAKKVHLPEAGKSSDRSNGEGRGLAVTPARIPAANFSITDDLE
jgi:tetratricopeptide (TPR) repeat protein